MYSLVTDTCIENEIQTTTANDSLVLLFGNAAKNPNINGNIYANAWKYHFNFEKLLEINP